MAKKLEASQWPDFQDESSKEDLLYAIDAQLRWLESRETYEMAIADIKVDKVRLGRTLNTFRDLVQRHYEQPRQLRAALEQAFDVYLLHKDGKPDLLITGYYAPTYQGSFKPDDTYRFPLYRLPDDLIYVDTRRFDQRMLQKGPAPREARIPARIDGARVVGYFSREEIDEHNALAGKGFELVYLKDYFEQFTLHVQGGGFVQLPDGRYMKVDYAGKNGHSYTSIGRVMVEEGLIPKEKISMQAINDWFDRYPQDEKRICYQNASYVFYTTNGKTYEAIGNDLMPNGVLNFPVTPRRGIATDKRFFPGGALCFLQGKQRRLDGAPVPFQTFVLDQDTGGAIRNNHVDLFMGAGERAEEDAGQMNDPQGRLYFLVIKEES